MTFWVWLRLMTTVALTTMFGSRSWRAPLLSTKKKEKEKKSSNKRKKLLFFFCLFCFIFCFWNDKEECE